MPDQLQLRGGTTVQHSTFTGASKEVTVDTTKKTAVVHDGSTVGGVPMMREDASNAALALASAASPSLKFTGDTNTGVFSPGADTIAISTGGTSRLAVSTTAVSSTLAVDVPLGAVGTPSLTFTGDLNTGIWSPAADTIAFSKGGAEAMRLDSNGRLLVGTSSTVSAAGADAIQQIHSNNYMQLALINNVNAAGGCGLALGHSRGASAGTFNLLNDGDEFGAIYFVGADGTDLTTQGATIRAEVDGTPGANDMPGRIVLATTADGASSPTERMRITSDGYFKASNTGSYLNTSPGHLHEFWQSDAGFSSLRVGANNASYTGQLLQLRASRNTTNGTFNYLACYNDGSSTYRLYIADSGNVANVNNSYGAISDLKLKENIVDANSQWDDLKALRVRKYNFKEGQTHTQIGLVAQEAELVSPGLVSESPDRDADGNDLGTVTKSVNYSVLYMKAVKALQEAMERIEQLEAKVAALESA